MATVSDQPVRTAQVRYRDLLRPYARHLLLGALLLLMTNLCNLIGPRLINDAITLLDDEQPFWAPYISDSGVTVGVVSAILVVVALLSALVRVSSRVVVFNVGRDVERDLRQNLFTHLSVLSPKYFQNNEVGDLMNRMTTDLNNIRLLAGFALLNMVNSLFVFSGTLPLMIHISGKLTLAALAPFPIMMVVAQGISMELYRRVRKNQENLSVLTAKVQENLTGAQLVRVFDQGDAEIQRFGTVNDAVFGSSLRLATLRALMFPFMGLMALLSTAIALAYGGQLVVAGEMQVGDFVEINARLMQLTWPALALGFIISVYQRGKASLDRINQILTSAPEITDGPHTGELGGQVTVNDFSLRYSSDAERSLNDISISAAAGQLIGFVGKSGSGKSSLLRALSRQRLGESGHISFDGVAAEDWNLKNLHRQIALVPDEGFLFSTTLRENIALGKPNATDAEIDEVVALAGLENDISLFPDGLETMVGERGITLSGGQRQRVCLARAILVRPRILLLDDAMSAVDAETEARILTSLREGFASSNQTRPTVLVVSHRLSAMPEADHIYVLDKGRVVEEGRHADLMVEDGIYTDLWGRAQIQKQLGVEHD